MVYDLASQVELERNTHLEAVRRFKASIHRKKERGIASDCTHIEAIVRRVIEPLSVAIQDWVAEASTGTPGGGNKSAAKLAGFNPEIASLLVVKSVLDRVLSASPSTKQANVCRSIGTAIEDELKFSRFSDEMPGLWSTILKSVKGNDRKHKRTVASLAMRRYQAEWAAWSQNEQLAVGLSLLTLLVQSTGLVKLIRRRVHLTKVELHVELTDDAEEWLRSSEEFFASLQNINEPTIIPPKPWQGTIGGGYYDPDRRPVRLVKGYDSKRSIKALQHADFSPVLNAINTLQDTAWKVNRKVFEVFDWAVENELDIGGLPPEGNVPRPPDLPEETLTDEIKSRVRKQRYEVFKINRARRSKRLQIRLCRQAAKKFLNYDAIYMPYQVDFRGRVYAMPSALHPQGPDYMKSLLTFAEGKPIETEEQAAWLSIHLANCFGVDKVSFEDRIQWVEDHIHRIHATANDPKAYQWWTEADDPWQFLAACFEFSELATKGYGFVSHLPVHVDGSCNGIQHYSAMLRDQVGGSATNLTPSDKPQDIYSRVADKVIVLLGDEKDEPCMAKKWVDLGINRKTTKRPVMVLPYGGTISSTREYVEDAYREATESKQSPFADDEESKAITLLSRSVWTAMGQVIVAGRGAMDWLRSLACVLSKSGLPIQWITPSGFVVTQLYEEQKSNEVMTKINGNIKRMRAMTATGEPHKNKQRNGLPPNFVHSLDASHLVLTVNAAREQGMTSFSTVHDSYGCLAADMPSLSKVLRREFVRMYVENDPLGSLYESYKHIEGVVPPPLPGTLDISQVIESPYFFA